MNRGTRIRAIALGIAVLLAILAIFDVFASFWIKVLISVALVVAAILAYYYNNDLTVAACEGTGITRQKKREEKFDYIGEEFYAPIPKEIGMEE